MLDVLGADYAADFSVQTLDHRGLGIGELVKLECGDRTVLVLTNEHEVKDTHGRALDQVGKGWHDLSVKIIVRETHDDVLDRSDGHGSPSLSAWRHGGTEWPLPPHLVGVIEPLEHQVRSPGARHGPGRTETNFRTSLWGRGTRA